MSQPSLEKLEQWMAAAPKEHPPVRFKVYVALSPKASLLDSKSHDIRWIRATSTRRAQVAAMIINRTTFNRKAFGATAELDPPGQLEYLRKQKPWAFREFEDYQEQLA